MRAFIDSLVSESAYYNSFTQQLVAPCIWEEEPHRCFPCIAQRLFAGIGEHFDLSHLEEFTFEANPATFTAKKVELFKQLGITRVSLGVQSFSDRILSTLGREHSREKAIESVQMLKQVGMREINIDLMFAVPGQPLEEWQDTLDTAVALKPDHISCYNLTYEEDTEFIEKLTTGEYQEDEVNASYFETCHNTLTRAGCPLRNLHYAQPGKQSRHNQGYWQGNNYLGIGPSAVGTVNRERYKNIPDTAEYIKMVNHIGHSRHEIERLDDEAFRIERIALLLRTSEGLPKKWVLNSHPPRWTFYSMKD